MSKLRKELQDTSSKLISTENERNNLRTEITRIQQELTFGEEQMRRKTDEYQAAIEDWTNAHRQAEDARVNAIQELETKKYELSDLQSRLDSTEQRLAYLQQEYIKADNERDALRDSLRRFQSSISRVININRFSNIDVS
uniref:Myosin_tail_1 domain-containing protein n=1 Tax=Bursaphelenchus xylophilus TaxID=6326 RepID=A0A1I7SKH6_BURXY